MATSLLHTLLSATTALASVSYPHLVLAQEARYNFELPEQDLASALRAYAKVTGQQVAFDGELVRNHRSTPVIGSYTADDALRLLLRDTGLTVRAADHGVLIIEDPNRAAPTQHFDGLAEPAAGIGTTRPLLNRTQKTDAETIVVTGSHIRGKVPAGANIQVVTREELDQSGYATTQQLIQSLPQNFGGGASEDTSRGTEAISTGNRKTTGINLRGLGNVATLVLLNGRRLAGASDNGDIPDISLIPTTAIERIEILPDGASSVYGSDAVAGVVNFILRSDYEGAETTLRYGTVTNGSLDEYQVGQTFGFNWNDGNLLLAGEFYHRDRLPNAERRFSQSSDLTPAGGRNWGSTYSVPGNILDPSTFAPAFAIPSGQDGRNLSPANLLPASSPNIFNTQLGTDLLPRQRRYSLFSRLSQDLTPDLKFYAEAFFSQRNTRYRSPSPSYFAIVGPDTPFYVDAFGTNEPLYVTYNFHNDYGPLTANATQKSFQGTAGGEWDINHWLRATGYYTYAKSIGDTDFIALPDFAIADAAIDDPNRDTALNVLGNGFGNNPETIARIFSDTDYLDKIRTDFQAVNLFVEGDLAELPSGTLQAGVGGELRWEHLHSTVEADRKRFRRKVAAAFGEIRVPIVSERNRIQGIEALDVSFSLRTERYEDAQTAPERVAQSAAETTNPKVGANWTPVQGLTVQGSYGTAFRAPSLPQQAAQKFLSFGTVLDPLSPSGQSTALFISGTQPDLENEKATIWTVGATLEPGFAPGLRLRGTYYHIKFKNRIAGGLLPDEMLGDEGAFSDYIIRNPNLSDLQSACRNGVTTSIPPAACITPGVAGLIFDLRTANRAVQTTSGIDLLAAYAFDLGRAGLFTASINGTYILSFKESPTSTAPAKSILDTFANPIDLRIRGSLGWATPYGLTTSLFINYTDSYTDHISSPERKISSHTTVDLTVNFNAEDQFRSRIFEGLSLMLSVNNLFANDPPFVDTLGGYDPENADPLGRLVSLTLRKRF